MNVIRMNTGLLYFAYGANTNKRSMALRCPDAKPLGATTVNGYRLAFRGVADIVERANGMVHGALWRITPECEAALDSFEGFPNLYIKKYGKLRFGGKDEVVMMYVMRKFRAYSPPSESYRQCLLEGYGQFGLPTKQIHDAVVRAVQWGKRARQNDWVGWDDTPITRERIDISGMY